ncbi:hypothetical protein [Caballeronia sp. LZ034LL]|uniref:hypothetical protein n=1 Tax=Caballeronia sp. LZ034LL TaxID=3038567 RepID=UPI0028584C07|nr:hypothetical protein [Caballeronia sp. LZ034LL]MDR5835189.1 hypothetical protein [Caballeronia sp. LZ034LL]
MTIYGSLFGGSIGAPGSRLIIPVVALGSETLPTPSPLILDTGSAGMAINAQDVFPADMVSTNGFVFPPGQSMLTYHGIIVTNVQAKKVYGDGSHAEYGNIGFATVRFGGQGELTTNLMPVLFSYKMVDSNGQLLQQPEHGIFGINSAAGAVLAAGAKSSGSLNICSPQSITANGCDFVSVLRYLNYAPGVNAGFSLGNTTLDPNCLITASMTGCTLQSALTVGLSAADEQAYSSTPLTCPDPGFTGSDHGVTACDPDIFGGTISDSGSGESFAAEIILDSGTPTMKLSVPPTATFPQSLAGGSTETFTLPGSPLTFSYQANVDLPSITAFGDYAKLPRTIIGIGFFTDHQMFIDLSSNQEGWK